jgi:ABC-type Fe3+ transport system permease subunit
MIAQFSGLPFPARSAISTLLFVLAALTGTGLTLAAMVRLRCAPTVYVVSLLLTVPATLLALTLPAFWWTGLTSLVQGLLLVPLLVLPLTLPLRALPANWTATAQELGAPLSRRLTLLWWPLLKKPVLTSLVLVFICGILQ